MLSFLSSFIPTTTTGNFSRCIFIASIGNPGAKYAKTRHNAGDIFMDELISKYWKDHLFEKSNLWYSTKYPNLVLYKSNKSYMNLQGRVIHSKYKMFNKSMMIILHDELQLKIGKYQIRKEGTSSTIWTIFFTRLFGPVTPMDQEFLEITYPMASNLPDLDSLIDDKISKFLQYIDRNPITTSNGNIKHTINIEFYNTKDKPATTTTTTTATTTTTTGSSRRKSSGWFGGSSRKDDKQLDRSNCWEIWLINVEILPMNKITPLPHPINTNYQLSPNIEKSRNSFESNLLKIYDLVDEYKDHIPPITSLDSAPFPYEININDKQRVSTVEGNPDDSWGTYIKKILD
ncbi:unnamed protein product [Candida verbasci]|uniref:Autophagy-related protein 101 n=1 Tax=Candida verbasci TaxID=1227364 RepID=A0A9W4TU25_9ASCO|nr:unnamed protein product [Candida verbasci]